MGRIGFFSGVFLFCLLAFASQPAFAQLNTRGLLLAGTVYCEGTNQRVAYASVRLQDDRGELLQEFVVNDSGQFSFRGVSPGNYTLRVSANGYESTDLRVDVSMNSQQGLIVSLKPARASQSNAADHATISAHELAIPEAARKLLTSGKKKLYAEKNAQAALRDFLAASAKAPAYYEAYYQAGMAYLTLQKQPEAESQFRKSVDLSQKKYADADIALATLLLQRNEQSEGESLLRQGLALNPQSWPGQFELGKLELSRGNLQPALAAAQTAESLAPQQPLVYRLLALVHMRQQNYFALLSDLDSYIRLDPDSPAGLRAKELRKETQRKLGNPEAPAVSAKQ